MFCDNVAIITTVFLFIAYNSQLWDSALIYLSCLYVLISAGMCVHKTQLNSYTGRYGQGSCVKDYIKETRKGSYLVNCTHLTKKRVRCINVKCKYITLILLMECQYHFVQCTLSSAATKYSSLVEWGCANVMVPQCMCAMA